ncbi:MAG: DNA internalization-related competence protein ComEC/Rec2 [Rhodanobacteraceae bacterium]
MDRRREWFRVPGLTGAALFAAFAGVFSVQLLSRLPATGTDGVLIALALALLFVRRAPLALPWLLLGFGWSALHADLALSARLARHLEGQDIQVVGHILGLPQAGPRSSRFDFKVSGARRGGVPIDLIGHVRLSWYDSAPALPPCSEWALTVRLKRPRGLINPGGFDFERYAAQRGIVAVGYVRDDAQSHALASGRGLCVDALRLQIGDSIARHLAAGPVAAILQSLAVGDRRALDEDDWQVLRATGTSHLVAISGLHVGLFAALGALLARTIWKLCARSTLKLPGPLIEAPVALAFACTYGVLAGLGVPTLRSLLMIATVLLARYVRRGQSLPRTLALAALAVLLWDPLAMLASGFWLSFAGVAALLLLTIRKRSRAWWRRLPPMQLALSIALLPLTVWFFGQVSLIGPLANLIAVPWVSFVVTPLAVAGGLLLPHAPVLGAPLIDLAAAALKPLWWLLAHLAAMPQAQLHFSHAPGWSLLLAFAGVIWCMAPRGVPLRWLGAALLLPLLFAQREVLPAGEFEITVLDVGQGLSVLVRTTDHALLFDAGARYPSGFDLGEAAVIPALRALGVERLDRLIISHGDNDHAGGARSVALALRPGSVESGEPLRLAIPASQCVEGERWPWDGVDFRLVSPPRELPSRNNDRSCVLLVSGHHGSALLPGDISWRIEAALPRTLDTIRHPLVLIVPHHGSSTSSSAAFLDDVRPDLALVSAGYRNRFGHPRAEVVARYGSRGIPLFGTARSGAIDVRVGKGPLVPARWRLIDRFWWREP